MVEAPQNASDRAAPQSVPWRKRQGVRVASGALLVIGAGVVMSLAVLFVRGFSW
jgi:hypothetical protein